MAHANVNGIKINYTEVGQGDPLLLIMGYGMPGEAWMGSLPFLEGFRTIYFDNRGTGLSDKPGGPYTIAQMAADAGGLLDALGIERSHVYGISMGGMIAQELAITRPEKVRSLVLGCTMCGGTQSKLGEPEVIDALVDVISTMGTADQAAWVEKQLPLLFPNEWVEANPAIRDLMLMAAPMLPPTPPETAQHALAGIQEWGTYNRLPRIKAPTLVIHGDRDVLIPVENAYLLAECIPGAKLRIVKGAGHGYPAQDPVTVHTIITDFLRSH